MADVYEISPGSERASVSFVFFAIFIVIDFHLCTTGACGCDCICRLNDLGSWCTSNRADFYSDDTKIDQLVHIKQWILLS